MDYGHEGTILDYSEDTVEHLALDAVKAGDQGFLSFSGVADATVQRLMSMGLIPGAFVKVTRVAPLGDPIMLEICGYQVCVRRREAAALSIRLTGTRSRRRSLNDPASLERAGSADSTNKN